MFNIKLIKNILIILLIMFSIQILFINQRTLAIEDIITSGTEFLSAGESVDSSNKINTTAIKTTSDYIYNILLTIGIIIAMAVGSILGIQFMLASVEDKAKIKESLIPYIVGCVVVFGAFGIWGIAVNMGNKVIGDELAAYSESKGTKAKEYYDNKNIDELGDQEVIDLFENLKKYDGEDEVDSGLYNYYKEEADKRKGNIIRKVYDDDSIKNLSDDKLNDYFDNLKNYSGEDEVDPQLYYYFKDEIERRENEK